MYSYSQFCETASNLSHIVANAAHAVRCLIQGLCCGPASLDNLGDIDSSFDLFVCGLKFLVV